VRLTDVEATPSKPEGALTELQSPTVAGVGAPAGDEVSPAGGSCAALFDAPPTWFAADFWFVTGCAATLDPESGLLPVATGLLLDGAFVSPPVAGGGDGGPPDEPVAVSPGF